MKKSRRKSHEFTFGDELRSFAKLILYTGIPLVVLVLVAIVWSYKSNFFSVDAMNNIDVTWQVKSEDTLPITSVNKSGGENQVKITRIAKFKSRITNKNVSTDVAVTTSGQNKVFTTTVGGKTSLGEMNKTLFTDLRPDLNLMGGNVDITINGTTKQNQSVPITIESNPSTGYGWFPTDNPNLNAEVSPAKIEPNGNPPLLAGAR